MDDIVDGTVGRMLARLGIENELYYRWLGVGQAAQDDQCWKVPRNDLSRKSHF